MVFEAPSGTNGARTIDCRLLRLSCTIDPSLSFSASVSCRRPGWLPPWLDPSVVQMSLGRSDMQPSVGAMQLGPDPCRPYVHKRDSIPVRTRQLLSCRRSRARPKLLVPTLTSQSLVSQSQSAQQTKSLSASGRLPLTNQPRVNLKTGGLSLVGA